MRYRNSLFALRGKIQRVKVDNAFKCRNRAIVHVRRGKRDIAQARRFECMPITQIVTHFEATVIAQFRLGYGGERGGIDIDTHARRQLHGNGPRRVALLCCVNTGVVTVARLGHRCR